ncbi:MAG TPA: heme-binding domain-containing protein [Bacteroidales bacterium]|jgi:hypothetical protein|nr:heme-binding domain-containing protein [Bacteroidales bacterium]
MKAVRIILLALALAFVSIQFIPSGIPENKPESENSIIHSEIINDTVLTFLRASCYDCHSDQTNFPWYAKIAPSSWFLAGHIKEGREQLNFSEWETYSLRKKIGKLGDIGDEVSSGEMPLKSYLLIHRDAKLDNQRKDILMKWVEESTARLMK